MNETLTTINQMQADGVIGNYAIGGAIGASFYLEPTTSLDIDVFLSFDGPGGNSLAPLAGIYEYLKKRGCEPKNEHVFIKGWLVQFLPAYDELYKEALAQAIQTQVRGVTTWVMTAEHLMAMALKLGRQKDIARIERFIEIGHYDPSKLDDILSRHNLTAKWKPIIEKYTGVTK